jgi:hypothetical protein
VTEDEYRPPLQYGIRILLACTVAAASGKSADPILHRTKIIAMLWAILKIKEGLAYLSLDLSYHLKG